MYLNLGIDDIVTRPKLGWLGGFPRMPSEFAWPRTPEAEPMHFLGCIDLAALPGDTWDGIGPRTGFLSLFMHDTGSSVIYTPTLGEPREPPQNYPGTKQFAWDKRTGAGSEAAIDRAWPQHLLVQEAGSDVENPTKTIGYQLDGEPVWLQEMDFYFCGFDGPDDPMRQWMSIPEPYDQGKNRLLLQIPSDARMKWMWGDVGALYFIVAEVDLAAGRFDRVIMLSQSH